MISRPSAIRLRVDRRAPSRRREVVLRLLRGESVELLSRELGVPIYKLEQWREKADAALDGALKERESDPRAANRPLRATLQRWPAANGPIVDGFDIVPGKPVDSVDGLSPPSLTTGASATSARSISRLMTLITPVSSRTNSCPETGGSSRIASRSLARLAPDMQKRTERNCGGKGSACCLQ